MSDKLKKYFVLELVVIALSLLPLLMTFLIPKALGGVELDNDVMFVIYGYLIYLIYPFVSLVMGVICSCLNVEWYLSMSIGGAAFILASILFLQLPILTTLLWALIYAVIGFIPSYPIYRYKKRKEKDDKYLGKI